MDQKKENEEASLKKLGQMQTEKNVQPQKKGGPQQATAHDDAVAASRLAAEPGSATAEKARKMSLLQKKVGNTRLARMLSTEHPPEAAQVMKEEKSREQDHTPPATAAAQKEGEKKKTV